LPNVYRKFFTDYVAAPLAAFIIGAIASPLLSDLISYKILPLLLPILYEQKVAYLYDIDTDKVKNHTASYEAAEKYTLIMPWGSTEAAGRMIEIGAEKDKGPLDFSFSGMHVNSMLALAFKKTAATDEGGGSFVSYDANHDGTYVGLASGLNHDAKQSRCRLENRYIVVSSASLTEADAQKRLQEYFGEPNDQKPAQSASIDKRTNTVG
jgi:hypothetical protein